MVVKLGQFGDWIRNTWKVSEIWCLRRTSWTDRVRKEEVLNRVKEE